ncbi:hypothetical protein H8B02_20620 [Bradyrhizobium sp. Pear77]|uniref:hypothetical protein n=1 Tax=Bradyrhizobium altum TaxID=1571202 RepID=UPI001E5FF4FF|nr:hypothetical protein [Bradyrhizobium altum]MCC8955749.1 hypothetical protein [Bradyrhizobium altum]
MRISRFDVGIRWPEGLTPDRARHSARSEKLFADAAIALSLQDVALARTPNVLFAPSNGGAETNTGVRIAFNSSVPIWRAATRTIDDEI